MPQWYADGQRKLPGEQALAAKLSVSRQTLRQALAVLEQEGLIEKRRGSGSFLCPAAARQDRRIAVIATSLSDYIFPRFSRTCRPAFPRRASPSSSTPRKTPSAASGIFCSSCCSIPRRGSWSRDARRRCRTRTRSSIRRSGSAGCR
ncbi:MAG: GntR family transcriptional regulator [Oscillospiraceae bacterium]